TLLPDTGGSESRRHKEPRSASDPIHRFPGGPCRVDRQGRSNRRSLALDISSSADTVSFPRWLALLGLASRSGTAPRSTRRALPSATRWREALMKVSGTMKQRDRHQGQLE